MATPHTNNNAHPHTTWNFFVIVSDASIFFMGLAFVDPVVVLPVLIERLGGSELVIGLVGALQRAGWIVPQIIGTSFVLHRSRKKRYLLWPVLLSRTPFLVLAVAFSLPHAPTFAHLLLLPLLVIWGLFFFLDGVAIVPWNDIIARTIPSRIRGRFFGSMQFGSALLAAVAALVVQQVLTNKELAFPTNYGRLLTYTCICMVLSTLALALIKEPEGAALEEKQTVTKIIRSIPEMLRKYPLLRRCIIAQNLLGFGALAFPFYAVYANLRLGLPEAVGGVFILVGTLGALVASIAWAYINDRHGPLSLLRVVALTCFLVPLSALAMPLLARTLGLEAQLAYCYALTFALIAASGNGIWMGITNYLFEIAPEDTRPLFLGVSQTLVAPTVLLPVIGGWLLGLISYEALFLVTAIGLVLALIYIFRLSPPTLLVD